MFKTHKLHTQMIAVLGIVISTICFGILVLISINFDRFSDKLYIDFEYDVHQTQMNLIESEAQRLGNLVASHSYWTDLLVKSYEKDTEWIQENATKYLIDSSGYNVDSIYLLNKINGYEEIYGDVPKDVFEAIIETGGSQLVQGSSANYLVNLTGKLYVVSLSALGDSEGSNLSGYYMLGHHIDVMLEERILELYSMKATVKIEVTGTNQYEFILIEDLDSQAKMQPYFTVAFSNISILNQMNRYTLRIIQIVFIGVLLAVLVFLVAIFNISRNIQKGIESIKYLTFHDFSRRIDLDFSREFVDLSHCINNLTSELESRELNINQKYVEIITILITALETVDLYTKGHSERVSHYSVEISKAIGYEDIEVIRLSGLLHDIGKISIDTKILNKPSSLTDLEFDEIKKHPLIAFQILEASEIFSDVKDIVKYHHEKMDGTGYPECIMGDAIPLGARIVAIADVFDSLTSERSYRKAMSVEEALHIIEKGSGTHFDADLVAVFLPLASAIYDSWSGIDNSPLVEEILENL